jgi:hypothetical protein
MDLKGQKSKEIENYIKSFKEISTDNSEELKSQMYKSIHENASCSQICS